MKTPLYLVAMRASVTGNQIVWLSTSDYKDYDTVVALETFEFEYVNTHTEEEIEALLDAKNLSEIETLEAKLKELKGLKNETA